MKDKIYIDNLNKQIEKLLKTIELRDKEIFNLKKIIPKTQNPRAGLTIGRRNLKSNYQKLYINVSKEDYLKFLEKANEDFRTLSNWAVYHLLKHIEESSEKEKPDKIETKGKKYLYKRAYELHKQGLSNRQIAENIGVKSHKTAKKYYQKYKEKLDDEKTDKFRESIAKEIVKKDKRFKNYLDSLGIDNYEKLNGKFKTYKGNISFANQLYNFFKDNEDKAFNIHSLMKKFNKSKGTTMGTIFSLQKRKLIEGKNGYYKLIKQENEQRKHAKNKQTNI